MFNNGNGGMNMEDSSFWGMHIFWWILIIVFFFAILGWLYLSRKRK